MKIEYTREEARAIERSYFNMIDMMKNPRKGRKCSKRELFIASGVMLHTLSVCGVRFTAVGVDNGVAFRVFAPDGNEFAEVKTADANEESEVANA